MNELVIDETRLAPNNGSDETPPPHSVGHFPLNAADSSSEHWQPIFGRMLQTVRDSGSHGQLTDVRDLLRKAIKPDRPLVMLCPHADDGAITAACLMHEFAVRRGLPVIEVLVFTGERNVAAPWLPVGKKVTMRENEFRLECEVVGADAQLWELEGYQNKGYQPTPRDINKIVDWFRKTRPGAVIIPPATDAHLAHRMTRALAAIGLLGAELRDTLVMTGWTPWGPLPKPNAYFQYDGEAERTKEWAIQCHASQILLTDYAEFCTHLGRAYAALTREWSEGHTITGRAHQRQDYPYVGVELFQVEAYDAAHEEYCRTDPIQVALGVLGGQLDPETWSPALADAAACTK